MTSTQSTRYMFVDCPNPQQVGIQRSKGSKSQVRAHVTKEYHRRVRIERLQAFKSKEAQSPALASPETSLTSPPLTIKSESESENKSDDEGSDFVQDVVSISPTSATGLDTELAPSLIQTIGKNFIWSMLSQSRSDPFNCLPVQDLPKYMQRVLDHALTHTWPATIPAKGKALDNPINAAWLRCCMEYPVLFHAFLYAAGLHLQVANRGVEDTESMSKLRFAHYSQTIKLMYDHIAHLQGPPPDALIMAVTTLAVHGRPFEGDLPVCHPRSPLAEQQYLHVYGQMLMANEHIPALTTLIQSKGGIEAIETYGMRECIQLADIYFATVYFKKPAFKLLEEPKSLIESGKLVMDEAASKLNAEIGSRMNFLAFCTSGRELLEAVGWMREVIVALDQLVRRASGAPDMVDLIPIRNAAQHMLVSIESSILTTDSEEDSVAYICRIATAIFSDMVIFPQTEAQKVKVRRAIALREAFEHHFERYGLTREPQALIWATLLGAIGTSFTPGQTWFLRRLRWQSSELGLEGWPSLHKLCSTFLWWRPVCDEPGLRIWNDMLAHSICNTYGPETG